MTVAKEKIDQMSRILSPYQLPTKSPYVVLAAKFQGVMIQAYTSGKVVFQGTRAEEIASQFGYQGQTEPRLQRQDFPLIGTDEVGNGSYFGGIAVVASYVTPDDHSFLRQLGVADSKQISDDKIRQIAPLLKEKIPHQALLLTPEKYNQVVGPGKPYNAVSVKVSLHNQAIFLLSQKASPEKIVIDAFTSAKNYHNYVKHEKNQVRLEVNLEEKAEEKFLAVAVSSILARQLFLDNLTQLSQTINYQLPSGAGSKSDLVASKILATHGLKGLEQTAKSHFANTKKAQNLLQNKGK